MNRVPDFYLAALLDGMPYEMWIKLLMATNKDSSEEMELMVNRAWHSNRPLKEVQPIRQDEGWMLWQYVYCQNGFVIAREDNEWSIEGYGYPILVRYNELAGLEPGLWKTFFPKEGG